MLNIHEVKLRVWRNGTTLVISVYDIPSDLIRCIDEMIVEINKDDNQKVRFVLKQTKYKNKLMIGTYTRLVSIYDWLIKLYERHGPITARVVSIKLRESTKLTQELINRVQALEKEIQELKQVLDNELALEIVMTVLKHVDNDTEKIKLVTRLIDEILRLGKDKIYILHDFLELAKALNKEQVLLLFKFLIGLVQELKPR